MASKLNGKSKDIIYISILLTVALCVGAYLISTTVLIAKDGVTFIEYAKKLESAPIETMKNEYQHPGYPFLILTAHRIAKIASAGSSLWSWIYCAQVIALIFRLFAVVVFYFVGKEIVGPRFSFLAILVLILLPKPAEYGSDALSDWPHIFFLSTGFLLLIRGARGRKWWIFGFVGLAAGAGYLVRPECVQLIIYGVLWLGLQLSWAKGVINRRKAVFAMGLLLIGFLVITGPYMKLKGAVFPKKNVGRFTSDAPQGEVHEKENQIHSNSIYAGNYTSIDTIKALDKLLERVGDTLMWFFVLALLAGIHRFFRERDWREPEKFFMTTLIALNIPLMIWLYCKYGYIDVRHTLPLVAFTIFFVPIGLQTLVAWFLGKFSKGMEQTSAIRTNREFWFFVLLVIGISICIPKLLKPTRTRKQSYLDAAQWLVKNTDEKDIVAVSDIRISFYSGREGVQLRRDQIPADPRFIVKEIVSEGEQIPTEVRFTVKKIKSEEKVPRYEEKLFSLINTWSQENPMIAVYGAVNESK
jgi:hypothetical protein